MPFRHRCSAENGAAFGQTADVYRMAERAADLIEAKLVALRHICVTIVAVFFAGDPVAKAWEMDGQMVRNVAGRQTLRGGARWRRVLPETASGGRNRRSAEELAGR